MTKLLEKLQELTEDEMLLFKAIAEALLTKKAPTKPRLTTEGK